MPRIDRTGWCALEISRLKPLLQAGGVKRSPGRALVVLLVLQLVACATGQDGDAANASTITGDDAWTFEGTPAWQDEFDYTGRPDPAKWGHDLGGDGWGKDRKEHTSELQSLMRISYAVFCLKKKKKT